MVFYITERAVKEIVHEFKLEALPGCLMLLLCLFQSTSGLILFIRIIKVIKLTI